MNYTFYKISCNDPTITEIYIGSTTDFKQREAVHKCVSKTSNFKVYQFIRQSGDWKNWRMSKIFERNCNNKIEARGYERKTIELFNATLNSDIPNRTSAEWFRDNKEHIKKYKAEYYQRMKRDAKIIDDINKINMMYKMKLI